MEDLTLEQKETRVREHYERAYKAKLRNLKPEEILHLYKSLRKLGDTEMYYEKKRHLSLVE